MRLLLRFPPLAFAAVSLCALASCGDRHDDPRPNIVLVVFDTLRRDRVGCYGSARDTTPTLDELAKEAVRFANAYSTAPWTCPSVASILTGQLPSSHGLVAPATGFAGEVETLAEMLLAEGYATAGVISNPHLRKTFAFDQGFETWVQDQALGHKNITTKEVTREAVGLVQELAASDKPFFLFVLYFDPHYDYKRHPEYGFASDPGRITGKEDIHELRRLAESMIPTEIQYIRDVYDEEVRFTDEGIGSLLEALRRTGEYENSAIVVTSDHGEELLERSWLGHCRTLYDELMRIPLIVRPPHAGAARIVDTPISLLSLVPTLRELAGLDPNPPRVHAPSLLSLLNGDEPNSWPPIFCEVDFTPIDKGEYQTPQEAHKRALVEGGFKLIHDDVTRKVELYDLAQDPGELHDLAEAKPDVAQSLLARLERLHATAKEGATAGTKLELSEDELEELRALGYAGPESPAGEGLSEEQDR